MTNPYKLSNKMEFSITTPTILGTPKDIEMWSQLMRSASLMAINEPKKVTVPKIKNVIFSKPYTIVFWADGTKTTVTCGENDVWDEEKGISLAFVKKLHGNKSSYINEITPYLTENVEKAKTKAAEEQKKLESELKFIEERRIKKYIKRMAKKRIRKQRLEAEIQNEVNKYNRHSIKKLCSESLEKANKLIQESPAQEDNWQIAKLNMDSGDD